MEVPLDESEHADLSSLLAKSVNERDLEFESLTEMLDEIVINLPKHMGCGAHTFNIVASKDSEKAMLDAIFKKAYVTALGKSWSLWNLQSRSTVAADSIFEVIDSGYILISILETKRPALTGDMTKLKLGNFTDQDIISLKKYANVIVYEFQINNWNLLLCFVLLMSE